MSIFELKDIKTQPDIIHTYENNVKDSSIPLVIDNGSYQCRVGWACNTEPLLVFRNLIAKPRKDRNRKDGETPITPPIQIGNDIVNIEAMRFQLKTQFDRNVVTHYHNQEQIFDYIFKHLSIENTDMNNAGGVKHPIILTECYANPNYCRQLMAELLFECYNVPSISYGIDSLFSYCYNNINRENGLILSFGYHTTHVIPMLNGQVVAANIRRINLGGYHMINFMHRMLQLKYPVHITAITLSRIEYLLHNHSSVSFDYLDDLRKWSHLDYYEENVKKIQLSFSTPTSNATVLTAEQKFERKRELAKRLADINARKREERLLEDEELLQKLQAIRELYEFGEFEEFNAALNEMDISNYEELKKLILSTIAKIERIKQKIIDAANNCGVPFFVLPTTTVTAQIPQPPPDTTIENWVIQSKQRRAQILERRQSRRQRKQDLAKRRTAAAQERMRIISQLARKEKGTDDFGMRDEDWDVYKAISKETGDSDSEAENEKLLEIEEVLRHHDPEFVEEMILPQAGGAAESYQLHVGVESIRGPELLFQPSMIGSSEAGLAEIIGFVLKMFNAEEQLILANNIFMTGGCAIFPGLKERLSKEIQEIRPFQTPHKIYLAKNPNLDAWNGTREFANSTNINDFLTTKADYEEYGGEYLKQHQCSNLYFKTPAPIPIQPEGGGGPLDKLFE